MVNHTTDDLLGKAFISTLEKIWKSNYSICGTDNDGISLLQHGVYYTYVFYDKNGIFIGSFDIMPEECGY